MTRDQHMRAAKERALALLPASPIDALASFVTDVSSHPELANDPYMITLTAILMGRALDADQVRAHIEGFQ